MKNGVGIIVFPPVNGYDQEKHFQRAADEIAVLTLLFN